MSWTSVLLLLLSPITCGFTLAQTPDDFKDVIMGCSNMGVFHVERGRYQLTYEQADGLCKAYGVVLANEEQLKVAHQNNFQTCRNGWVYNKTVMIPRIDSNELCGGGKTGLIFVTDNQTKYDAYCFNATETKPINCATRTIVPTSPKPSTVAAVTEGTTAKTADTTTYAVKDNEGEEEVSTTSIPLVTSTEIWTNEDEVTSTPSMLSTLHEKNTGSRSSNKSRPYYIDWLIILAIALSVLILAFVCIAILYRRKYHGKKQKLVISGKPAQGSKEDTAQNEKEQEMVRLMNQEKAMENGGTNEDFTDITLDEQAEKV